MNESAAVRITEDALRSFLEEIRAHDEASRARLNSRRRTCVVCGAFLSRYNPSESHCAVHEPPSTRLPDRW
jgi:hypothetical protein